MDHSIPFPSDNLKMLIATIVETTPRIFIAMKNHQKEYKAVEISPNGEEGQDNCMVACNGWVGEYIVNPNITETPVGGYGCHSGGQLATIFTILFHIFFFFFAPLFCLNLF